METGEGKLLLEQIRRVSADLLDDLMEVDDRLKKIENLISRNGEIDKEELSAQVSEIRTFIGAMEKEDTQELEDEEILENMMKKLNDLITMTL